MDYFFFNLLYFICIYKNEVKLWDKITPPIINKSDIYRNNKLRDVVFKINNSIIKKRKKRVFMVYLT